MAVHLPESLTPSLLLVSAIFGGISVFTTLALTDLGEGADRATRTRVASLGSGIVGFGLWATLMVGSLGRRFPVPISLDPLWAVLAFAGSVLAASLLFRACLTRRRWQSIVLVAVASGVAFAIAAWLHLRALSFQPLFLYDALTQQAYPEYVRMYYSGEGLIGSALLSGVAFAALVLLARYGPGVTEGARRRLSIALSGGMGLLLLLVQRSVVRTQLLEAPEGLTGALIPPPSSLWLFLSFAIAGLGIFAVLFGTRLGSGSRERTLMFTLTAGMGVISLTVGAVATVFLYQQALSQYRAQLGEMVRSQAEFFDALTGIALATGNGTQAADSERVMVQALEALRDGGRFGATGTIQLVRLDGDSIRFLFPLQPPISVGSMVGEPSRRAALGQRGSIDGLDAMGRHVLAATDYVPSLDLGIVAKIEMTEVRGPFLRTGFAATLTGLLLVAFASWVFVGLARPFLRALEQSSFVDVILASAPQAVLLEGGDGRLIRANRAFSEITGTPSSALTGLTWRREVLPIEEVARFDGFLREIRAGSREVREFQLRHPSGRSVWIRVAGSPTPEVSEGAVLLTLEDVTEAREARLAMEEAEGRFRELIESSSDFVWTVDREGRWLYANPMSEAIYGIPPEELVGSFWQERSGPEKLAEDERNFEKILSGQSLSNYETVHQSIQGEPRYLSISVHPFRDSSGEIVGAQGISRDISARRRLEEELRHAAEEADSASRAKSAFLANMSHEIRTPMNGVMGMTELLLDEELAPEHRRSLETIQNSAEALLAVLDDVLDLSKIEAGQLTLEQLPMDLEELGNGVIRVFAVRAHAKGLELNMEIDPTLARLRLGDPVRLRQVLSNLVSNAVKFTEHGDILLTITPPTAHTLRSAAGDSVAAGTGEAEGVGGIEGAVHFAVRDTGVGIPPEKVDRIFEEFSQADVSTTRTHGGTGLGLSISKRLVGMMGGTLSLTSVPGEGSEFSFVLPMALSADAPPAPPERIELDGLSFLIVDDHPVNRRVLRGFLAHAGAHVLEAASVEEAFRILDSELAKGRPPAAILTDEDMPGESGFQFGLRLGAEERYRAIPRMLVTSTTRGGDTLRARTEGFSGYLVKPVSRTEMLQAVSEIVGPRGTPAAIPEAMVTRPSMQPTGPALRILIAEDNPVNQLVARSMLEKRGHRVEVVETGTAALERARKGDLDLILMDVQMPEMDGLEATRILRREGHGIRIVALTAHALQEERERTRAAGMNGFVSKPFKAHELFRVVEALPGSLPAEEAEEETRRQ